MLSEQHKRPHYRDPLDAAGEASTAAFHFMTFDHVAPFMARTGTLNHAGDILQPKRKHMTLSGHPMK